VNGSSSLAMFFREKGPPAERPFRISKRSRPGVAWLK